MPAAKKTIQTESNTLDFFRNHVKNLQRIKTQRSAIFPNTTLQISSQTLPSLKKLSISPQMILAPQHSSITRPNLKQQAIKLKSLKIWVIFPFSLQDFSLTISTGKSSTWITIWLLAKVHMKTCRSFSRKSANQISTSYLASSRKTLSLSQISWQKLAARGSYNGTMES